ARSKLNDLHFNTLRDALLDIKDKKALKVLKIKGFFPTSHSEYQPVEEGMFKVDEFTNCEKNG
ncbi:MAG: hypothetical protein HQL71_15815, partial [Magnetococcales bacterium]|nr:hypothetical protein [Magnetococcales bacterium]